MFNTQFTIHAKIRLQMLADLAKGIDQWEIRAKAAQMLVEGCYVDNEIQAHTIAKDWYECVTIGNPVLDSNMIGLPA